jgi:RimJ/RimL family protein N-acetyltransferase
VDEAYQGQGVATYMFNLLIKAAKERGIQGFTADVLASNRAMMAVFEKGGHPVQRPFGAWRIPSGDPL